MAAPRVGQLWAGTHPPPAEQPAQTRSTASHRRQWDKRARQQRFPVCRAGRLLNTHKGCQQHGSVPEAAFSGGNLHHKGFQGWATTNHAHLVPALVMVQIRVGH